MSESRVRGKDRVTSKQISFDVLTNNSETQSSGNQFVNVKRQGIYNTLSYQRLM